MQERRFIKDRQKLKQAISDHIDDTHAGMYGLTRDVIATDTRREMIDWLFDEMIEILDRMGYGVELVTPGRAQ